ncbi:MAG: acetyl-CoA carboxylase biotin carboxyl carrier protein [Opitutales bacterium]|nr:acetyl-CoA carboxylase biotin carboxyl carrier protein [Opitutales bacterium]
MDLSELKGIISLVQKSDLTELEIEFKDIKLRMTRPGAITPGYDSVREIVVQAPPPTPSGTTPPTSVSKGQDSTDEDLAVFNSPMVGTFYRKPSPDDPSFVKIGDSVKKGDVLCIIEAMKVMNEIQSEITGEIVDILVEDGSSVEFGQTLFRIKP